MKSPPVKLENVPKREARPKKTPERFANAIPESILDSLENGSNLEYSFFHESPKKIQKFEPKPIIQTPPVTHRLPVIQSTTQLTNQGPSSQPTQQSVIRQLIPSNHKPSQPTNQNGVSMEANQITENKQKPTQEDLKMVKSELYFLELNQDFRKKMLTGLYRGVRYRWIRFHQTTK